MSKLHKEWIEKELGEICTITSSKRIFQSEYTTNGIPFYRTKEIKELANSKEVTTELFISEEKYNEVKTNFGIPIEGDILMTAIGTIGEIYIVEKDKNFYFKDGNVLWLKEFKSASTHYLKFALGLFVEQLKKLSNGSTYSALPIEKLKRHKLLLPPIEEQKRIAEILDRTQSLISKRKEAIALLDTLTQSIFLEMFGNVVKNPKNIKTLPLAKVCKRITDGTHQPPKWSESGYPFLFVSNIISGEITFDTAKFISRETHEELTRRCPIEVDDILYSTVGSYGVPVIVKTDRKFAFQRHIAHIKPESNLIDSRFLCTMLASPPLKQQADRAARGVAQKTVNLEEIRKFIIFCPPLALQKEFAQRVEAVEKLKAIHRASLSELQALFASLQHRAFRGEL